jgi:hypothetical protein
MTRDEYTDLKEYIGFRRKYQSFPTGPACERERELDKKFEGLDIMAMVLGAYEKAQHELDAVQAHAFQYRSDKEDMQLRLKLAEETSVKVRNKTLADAIRAVSLEDDKPAPTMRQAMIESECLYRAVQRIERLAKADRK